MAEHTLYGKRKLCYTEVTDFTDFQGIGRDPLYKRFDSVYSVVEKNVEPQYRDFLAHPIYSDEDQILCVIVKTCSDIFYTIGQKKCPMPSAKIRNYSHSHNLMSK